MDTGRGQNKRNGYLNRKAELISERTAKPEHREAFWEL